MARDDDVRTVEDEGRQFVVVNVPRVTRLQRPVFVGAQLHDGLLPPRGRGRLPHLVPGCIVSNTAEVLSALLPDWQFSCEADVATGFDELVVRAQT
jgi:hypothetical protein